MLKICPYCNMSFHDSRCNVKYCSKTCSNGSKTKRYRDKHGWKKTSEYARERKAKLVRLAGNGCSLCGYNKCLAALDFHHVDPKTKKSYLGLSIQPFDKATKELRNCILLCANCHREVEAGVSKLV